MNIRMISLIWIWFTLLGMSTVLLLACQSAAQPEAQQIPEGWKPLFDGATLDGWEVTQFGGEGRVQVEWPARPFDSVSSAFSPVQQHASSVRRSRVAASSSAKLTVR